MFFEKINIYCNHLTSSASETQACYNLLAAYADFFMKGDFFMPNYNSKTWIPVSQAAALTHLSVRTIEKRSSDGNQNFQFLPKHLLSDAQYAYHVAQMNPTDTFSVDLPAPTETFGSAWLSNFLDVPSRLVAAAQIHRDYRFSSHITEKLTELAQSYGISIKTFYRYENRPHICQISNLEHKGKFTKLQIGGHYILSNFTCTTFSPFYYIRSFPKSHTPPFSSIRASICTVP